MLPESIIRNVAFGKAEKRAGRQITCAEHKTGAIWQLSQIRVASEQGAISFGNLLCRCGPRRCNPINNAWEIECDLCKVQERSQIDLIEVRRCAVLVPVEFAPHCTEEARGNRPSRDRRNRIQL